MGFFNGQQENLKINPTNNENVGFFQTYKQLPKKPAPPPPKTTLQKLDDFNVKAVKFFGGGKLIDYAGAKIAKATVPEEQVQFVDDSTTGKQALASAGTMATWVIPSSVLTRLGLKGAKAGFDAARLMKEGAIFGGAEGALRSTAETNEFFSPETAKQAVIGTTLGGFGGRLIGEAGTALTVSRAMRNKTPEQFAEEAAARAPYTIPEAGRPTLGQEAAIEATQGARLLPEPRREPIQLPAPGILESQANINAPVRIPEPPKYELPIVTRAREYKSRNDFIAAERSKVEMQNQLNAPRVVDGIKQPKATVRPAIKLPSEKSLARAWDEAHGTFKPKEVKTPKAKIVDESVTLRQPTKIPVQEPIKTEIPQTVKAQEIPATKTSPESVGYKEREKQAKSEEETFERTKKTAEESTAEVFSRGSHEEYRRSFAEDFSKDKARVERIALGYEQHPKGAAFSDAYLALLKGEAEATNNIQLARRLASSDVSSISGQKLEAAKLAPKQNISDTLRDILQAKKDRMNKYRKAKMEAEENELVNKAQEMMKNQKLSSKEIDDIIDSLICK